MDPESKALLEKTYKLVEANNTMLRKVRGVQKRAALFGFLKALVVLGISIGAFYFLQPYLDSFQQFMHDTSATVEKIKSFMPR